MGKHLFHIAVLSVSFSFCIYWFIRTPISGKALVVLGAVAALMMLADMSVWYKGLYVLAILALVLIENNATNKERAEFAKKESDARQQESEVRARQEQAFQQTKNSFDALIRDNKNLFNEMSGDGSYIYYDVNMPIEQKPTEIDLGGLPRGSVIANTARKFVGTYPIHDVQVATFCSGGWLPTIKSGTVFPNKLGQVYQAPVLMFSPLRNPQEKHWMCVINISGSSGFYMQIVHFLKMGENKYAWESQYWKAGGKRILRESHSPNLPKEKIRSTKWD